MIGHERSTNDHAIERGEEERDVTERLASAELGEWDARDHTLLPRREEEYVSVSAYNILIAFSSTIEEAELVLLLSCLHSPSICFHCALLRSLASSRDLPSCVSHVSVFRRDAKTGSGSGHRHVQFIPEAHPAHQR